MTGCGGGSSSSDNETTTNTTQETGQLESVSINDLTNTILTYEGSVISIGTFCADNKVKLEIIEDGSSNFYLGTRSISGDTMIITYTQTKVNDQISSVSITSNDTYPNGTISLGDGDGDLVLIEIERVESTVCSL